MREKQRWGPSEAPPPPLGSRGLRVHPQSREFSDVLNNNGYSDGLLTGVSYHTRTDLCVWHSSSTRPQVEVKRRMSTSQARNART